MQRSTRTRTTRHRLPRVVAALVAVVMMATLTAVLGPSAASAHPVCPQPTITGDRPSLAGRFDHHLALDGDTRTGFFSSHDDWQHVTVDLGCVTTFSSLRRLMGRPTGARGFPVLWVGDRSSQGETFSYSLDGETWIDATHDTTTGWEIYTPYTSARDAWHSVDVGWSERIRLNTPAQARFVRFHWDGAGNGEGLIELDIEYAQAGPLGLSLLCAAGEPTCGATAFGGHAGGYTFTWTSTGVSSSVQSSGSTSSNFSGLCTPGTRYSVRATVTDSHGRTATRSWSDFCVLIPF